MSGYEILPLKTAISVDTPSKAKLPCYSLKAYNRNPDFYGRKDVLDKLDRTLLPSTTSKDTKRRTNLKTFAICGVGGVGKTQIAVEFACSRKKNFDAVFWIHAADSSKLAADFAHIAVELGLEDKANSGDQVVSKNLVLQWLSRPNPEEDNDGSPDGSFDADPTWLLIFDNADDLEILRDYWPVSGSGSILLTSRDPLAKTQSHVHSTMGMDLDPLTPMEAAQLLRALTNYSRTQEDIDQSIKIGERLSGLPLAIIQIAGTILRRDLSFSEFLEFYEQESLHLEFHKMSISGQEKTIYTVWALEDLNPTASCLLDIISFLDADSIQESLFTASIKNGETEPNKIENFPTSSMAYVDARTELSRSSLLKRNIELRTLSIHRLIQDTIRARMKEERFCAIFEGVVQLLYAAWSFSIFDHGTERWATCERLFPHICFLKHIFSSKTELSVATNVASKCAQLLMDAGWSVIYTPFTIMVV